MILKTFQKLAVLLLITYLVWPVSALASVQTVWAVNDGEKVERDDLNNPNKSSNSAWDGRKIKLFGARNEIIAFQLIVEAGSGGIQKLTTSLSELRQQGGKAKIVYASPALDPTNYVGRPIQIFSINYMNVAVASHGDWVFKPGSPAEPKDSTGWKPVQLVPENATAGRGGFPLQVAPSQNQGIWIEVYTNKTLPAGIYRGEVNLSADGHKQAIPIELELFDFTLPDQNSMDAMVYYESLQPVMYQGRNLDPQYNRFAHRQRVALVHDYNIETTTAAKGRFSGQDFTKALRSAAPGGGT